MVGVVYGRHLLSHNRGHKRPPEPKTSFCAPLTILAMLSNGSLPTVTATRAASIGAPFAPASAAVSEADKTALPASDLLAEKVAF